MGKDVVRENKMYDQKLKQAFAVLLESVTEGVNGKTTVTDGDEHGMQIILTDKLLRKYDSVEIEVERDCYLRCWQFNVITKPNKTQ